MVILFDGLVLVRFVFYYLVNYCLVMIYGIVVKVLEYDEKVVVLEVFVEGFYLG